MRSALLGLLLTGAAGCSTTPPEHPWGVRSFILQPKDGDFAGGLAIERVYAEDRSISLSAEGFTRRREVDPVGFGRAWEGEFNYTVLRLEHRAWYHPGERLEPFLGFGLARVGFGDSRIRSEELTVFGSGGFDWWWTPSTSLELGLLYDVPVSSDDQGVAPDWLQLRLGLAIWF
ncbi:MAG: hypothetical protein ISR76_08045 [Planctomycetes bacterium]|nr:hypothetical protein [Planctomycetota bacterium]